MLPLILLAGLVVGQAAQTFPADVSMFQIGEPVVVTEIDTGRLKGDVRRLAWSADGNTLYLQIAEGHPPIETLRHYVVAAAGGALTPAEREPAWAAGYWAMKQDRVAPGLPALVIDVIQGTENLKAGVGQAGVLDRSASPDSVAAHNPSVDSLASGNMGNERARVVRLTLVGETIATWTNERPVPGARFSWGPAGNGALVYVGDKGQLVFLDQQKRRRQVQNVRNTLFPAWSADGRRVAYLQKLGRKKYAVMCLPIE